MRRLKMKEEFGSLRRHLIDKKARLLRQVSFDLCNKDNVIVSLQRRP